MKILSIETSCDETAVSIVEATGDFPHAQYAVLGNSIFSQIDIHREYGGVFPAVAKREHAKALVPMLDRALKEAGLLSVRDERQSQTFPQMETILTREPGLAEALTAFLHTYHKPDIDLIAVTNGPGLEPALWVGVSFAKALAHVWNMPVVPTNHMEGHVLSSLFDGEQVADISFPALALLISGGHTELVLMRDWTTYELVGQTRDDAVGEAFDKVARMMGLPYPGGPEISRRAGFARAADLPPYAVLPHPMQDSGDFDFSFSGLKTAVKYKVADKKLTEEEIAALSRDFEDTVTEVLLKKTAAAVEAHTAQTLILGGGVSANTRIREAFTTYAQEHGELALYLPDPKLSTDNSVMIALAGHARAKQAQTAADAQSIQADGNMSLHS